MTKIKTVTALFFSPTYTTKKCVVAIAKGVADILAAEYKECNITTPLMRRQTPEYCSDDLVVFGVPVYRHTQHL